jgi:hypothetical protein
VTHDTGQTSEAGQREGRWALVCAATALLAGHICYSICHTCALACTLAVQLHAHRSATEQQWSLRGVLQISSGSRHSGTRASRKGPLLWCWITYVKPGAVCPTHAMHRSRHDTGNSSLRCVARPCCAAMCAVSYAVHAPLLAVVRVLVKATLRCHVCCVICCACPTACCCYGVGSVIPC